MDKVNQQTRVLKALKERGTLTNQDFYKMYIPRFGARIYELRKDGHHIVTNKVRNGLTEYTLIEEKENE